MASGLLPATLKIHKFYVRGAERMEWKIPPRAITFDEGVAMWMQSFDCTHEEAVEIEERFRDGGWKPSDARTQDLYDALINHPYRLEKLAQEDERAFDQTAKADEGKLQITLVPRQIIRDIAKVRMYGNKKYGSSDNWKQVSKERYRDAMCRHMLAYLDDPKGVDEESGLTHLAHLATNVAFLCEMESWEKK